MIKRIFGLVRLFRDIYRWWIVRLSIRHIYGARPSLIQNNEFVVVTLVKDVEYYIDEFIEYHLSLGAKLICIIDNGSRDHTLSRARQHRQVAIWSTSLDFLEYESEIRRHFIKRHFGNAWVLCIDADEHFDFPYRSTSTMGDLLSYLNTYQYTAVVACMVDMFADGNYKKLPSLPLKESYKYCDIPSIKRIDYPENWFCTRGNVVADGVGAFMGGVRSKVTKNDESYLLVKHPLIYVDRKIVPFTHPHYLAYARIADFECVLLHYKLTDQFFNSAEKLIKNSKKSSDWVNEHCQLLKALCCSDNPFYSSDTSKYLNAETLIKEDFLYASRRFLTQFSSD